MAAVFVWVSGIVSIRSVLKADQHFVFMAGSQIMGGSQSGSSIWQIWQDCV